MDDDVTFCDGPMTSMRMSYGELECSVMVAANLSPDAIDTTLNDVKKNLVAAVRQLELVAHLESDG